jgi:hypothetical protein
MELGSAAGFTAHHYTTNENLKVNNKINKVKKFGLSQEEYFDHVIRN